MEFEYSCLLLYLSTRFDDGMSLLLLLIQVFIYLLDFAEESESRASKEYRQFLQNVDR